VPGTESLPAKDLRLSYRLSGAGVWSNEGLHWAVGEGVDLDGLEVTRPSLEDVYLSLTSPPPGGNAGTPTGGTESS